jgi:hypothetical protein
MFLKTSDFPLKYAKYSKNDLKILVSSWLPIENVSISDKAGYRIRKSRIGYLRM